MTQPSEASAAISDFDYPEAERLELIEEIHGRPVADPYRWLEDPEDPRTVTWSSRQEALYGDWLRRGLGIGAHHGSHHGTDRTKTPAASDLDLPGFIARLRRRLTELADLGSVSAPVWRGGRCFLTRRDPGQDHPVLYVTGPDGADRALIDPGALDPSGATTLDGWFPSADGALLAYFLSMGGTERPLLRVMEVASGRDVDGPIDRVTRFAFAWLPDGTGFYHQRRPTAGQVADGVHAAHRLVYLHRIGTPSSHDVLISGPEHGLPKSCWYAPIVTDGGRWLRLDAHRGLTNDIYLADLAACEPDAPEFTVLQSDADAITEPSFGRDGRIYALTGRDAPNGRLCVIDPEHPAYEHWHTLVPEDPGAVLKGFVILDDERGAMDDHPRLLVLRSRHALSELALCDLRSGEPTAGVTVELPGLGTVQELVVDPDGGPYAYFTYTDFRTPASVYRLDGRSGAVQPWSSQASPAAPVPVPVPEPTPMPTESTLVTMDGAAVQVSHVTYSSHDGTEVRMFILSPTGRPDRPRPTILYGYGAHGNPRTPVFNPMQLAWVEAGGVYAIANIRGGGEEGAAWHRAGMLEHRQNTFADFHAAGDHLVDQGWTTRGRLGIHGGSAGGQLVGVALAQRPEAYAAVLCSAPLLDMIRMERSPTASLWVGERGTVRDPEQFGWLLAQSPYYMLREGTAYPAILFTVFDGDTRVEAWHARKFAAALQHATSSAAAERPILLRRQADAGHVSRSASSSIALWSEQLGFLAAHLGLPEAAAGL